jgi:allantoate deiminase
MTDAGMQCELDAATNLVGRYDSQLGEGAPTLILGSHLDTVANAGKFDGVLGVLLGLSLVELFHAENRSLPFAIDVICFCEEEGIRYAAPYLGSYAVAGQFDETLLDRIDEHGITMRQAIGDFGGNPNQLASAAYDPATVVGFIEPHIEQGPVLDRADLPVSVVSAIAGQTRAAVTFLGEAGHAGTVPIAARHDALVAAARWITAIETIASRDAQLFATVGCLTVEPNISNVIPEVVRMRLDVRHANDDKRQAAAAEMISQGEAIAQDRGLMFSLDWMQQQPAVATDAALSDILIGAIAECGVAVQPPMPSGAGHDAAVMASRFPMAMLFVRCRNGISHHPEESVRAEDVAVALEVLWRGVHCLADAATEGTADERG